MKRSGILPRFNDLTVGARVGLGFGVALALVCLLALAGLYALDGVSRDVGTFSAASDLSQTAADADIGMRDLEVMVRDHLAEGDDESLTLAENRRDRLYATTERLLAGAVDPEDKAAAAAIRSAAHDYWGGFERVVGRHAERAHLMGERLEQLIRDLRERLDALKATGGVDSATLVSDVAIHVSQMREHLVRFVERRDAVDGERMRARLRTARDRLSELNRYLWVPGTRRSIAEAEETLTAIDGLLDEVEDSLTAEDTLRADVLFPAAAQVADRATDIRRRAEDRAQTLRGGLAADASGYTTASLWIGGAVLALGLGVVGFLVYGVSRPIGAMSRAATALADGRTDVALPAVARTDEIGALARAIRALHANGEEIERLRRQAAVAQQDMLAAKEQAEAATAAKTAFLVNMGHELHGPLDSIVRRSQALMGELHRAGAGDLANEVEMIQWSGEQLQGLVESILDYARIEAGTLDVAVEDFDPGRLLTEVRERCLPLADLNGNAVRAVGQAGLGPMRSDFGKVRQILLNLLDNACKFTQDGDVTLAAERLERDGRAWLRFTVTDTGVGFHPSLAGRLFQPFVQGAQPDGRKTAGAGLGLTLVAHYAAALGGEIEVASAPAKGTRVSVLLPAVYDGPQTARPLLLQPGTLPEAKLLTVAEPAPAGVA